jgi:hypothetical protein
VPKTNQQKALDPFEFRFQDKADKAKYGSRWFVYDEASILRLDARELIAIETDLDMSIPAMMNGFRQSSVLGDTAAAWLAIRQANPTLVGDFDDFKPIWAAMEWRLVPKDQPAEAVPDDSPTADGPSSTTSDQTASADSPVSLLAE